MESITIQSPVAELRQRYGYLKRRLAELDTFIGLKETQINGKDEAWVLTKWERTHKRRELRSVLFNLESYGQMELRPAMTLSQPFSSSSNAPSAESA